MNLVLAVVAALQLASDSLPRITLADALARGARLDPGYVRSLGQVSDAEWGRRAAISAMVLPAINLSSDFTFYSVEILNIGTGQRSTRNATARVDARYELFTGGRKLAELDRTRAELDAAAATAVQARYTAALIIESVFYEVLSAQELLEVARGQLRRGEEQMAVARARVAGGATVQSDSLQVLLELNRARANLVRTEAALRLARLDLGRRVGAAGPVDAVPLDPTLAAELPLTLPDAVSRALAQGPAWRLARANERAAEAVVRQRRAAYLPTLSVGASATVYDESWFPSGLSRSQIGVSLSFPLWDNAQRELAASRARSARNLARAVREDLERAAQTEVTAAYDAWMTARVLFELNLDAVVVAQENFRVQETRYRSGATTILDLLEAQDRLTQAEADVVRSRHAARLASAGLEAILGERLFNDKEQL